MSDNSLPASWALLSARTTARGSYLDPNGYCYAEPNTARGYEGMNVAFTKQFGYSLPVTEAGRTKNRQTYLYQGYKAHKPGFNLAALPGTSIHEKGRAIDFGGRCAIIGTAEHNWLIANGPKWGFIWTGKTFSQVEPWHFEQNGLVIASTSSTPIVADKPKPTPKDDDMIQLQNTASTGEFHGDVVALSRGYVRRHVGNTYQTAAKAMPVIAVSGDGDFHAVLNEYNIGLDEYRAVRSIGTDGAFLDKNATVGRIATDGVLDYLAKVAGYFFDQQIPALAK